jgi:hypothetical protein
MRPRPHALGFRGGVVLVALLTPAAALGWTARPTATDPLVRLPGTQPSQGMVITDSQSCLPCHTSDDMRSTPSFAWRGSLMGQAARDPLFWPTYTVALQDSIWAIGRPNAGDFCERCHFPAGWLEGRADPPNASAMKNADYDGVSCSLCHRTYDPYAVDTAAGTREGSDWANYWDEKQPARASLTDAIASAYAEDLADLGKIRAFNGNALFDGAGRPLANGWTENASAQFFISSDADTRGPYADSFAGHRGVYSRYEKSKYYCASCHDISNPVLANLPFAGATPGDGTTVLKTESAPAYSYAPVERTFSEFMLSDFAQPGGAPGEGRFAPTVFTTPHVGNAIASCQDCHMPMVTGMNASYPGALYRSVMSVDHPRTANAEHDLTGANALSPALLAAAVAGSPNYDATIAGLLGKGASTLTFSFGQGVPLDAYALLAARNRALDTLARAAEVTALSYDAATGATSFRVRNLTGHKLPSGFPEGRRAFVNIRLFAKGALVHEVNPYDATIGTLKGLPAAYSPASPALSSKESYRDELVYEARSKSALTGEAETLHFALATGFEKDNRIPPRGFRIAEAAARMVVPAAGGVDAPSLFTAAEYGGGYDEVALTLPTGADRVEVQLLHQTITREYVEFLRSELAGTAKTLPSPTLSGEPKAYVVQTDPFFAKLAAWGETTWALWSKAKDWPGAAPAKVASASFAIDRCAGATNGTPCDDGDACTTGDTCVSGTCKAGAAVACDDGNPCTDDACDAKVGCTHAYNTAPCDPIEPCHSAKCASGICVPGPQVWCPDAGTDASAESGPDAEGDSATDAAAEAAADAASDGAAETATDAASDSAPDGAADALPDPGNAEGGSACDCSARPARDRSPAQLAALALLAALVLRRRS